MRFVETYDLAEAAERSGVSADTLRQFCDVGIITPDADGRFSPGHLRRAGLVKGLLGAGIPLDGLAAAIRGGQVSLDFLDAPAFERFSALGGATFAEMAERSGVPIELLLSIRETAGSPTPEPTDRLREAELPYVDWLQTGLQAGIRAGPLQQLMRAQGDGLRRIAETEASMWQAEVIDRATAAGMRQDQILGADLGDRMSALSEQAVIGMYHLQQTRAWGNNIVEGLEAQLTAAGLHSRLEHPPAMCFLDITGYTRLTQEFGDAAAVQVAERLGTIVQRTSIRYGGRPVKWLGDGVMMHFPDPGLGVVAALEMVASVTEAGLPPAHVGLHAGPVIFQEGDYYGQTVNLASRIADYAKAGEVIVSQAVVEASGGGESGAPGAAAEVAFLGVGPVELKGVSGAMHLYAASRTLRAP